MPRLHTIERAAALLLLLVAAGCGSGEIKPVEIYAEDICSSCRMAISERSFASEIITAQGEVFKFDDLGCLEKFRAAAPQLTAARVFVTAYETREWIEEKSANIVLTRVKTPMGSGKVAFADSAQSAAFAAQYPSEGAKGGCCEEED